MVRFAASRLTLSVKILPSACDARHHRLASQAPVGTDLARHPGHLTGEGAQLIHHRIQCFLQQQDLAAHVDGDLARQVAGRDGGCDLGDVAHLAGQIACHGIDVVREILPRPRDAGHLSLAAQFAFGADFTRNAGHLAGEARSIDRPWY